MVDRKIDPLERAISEDTCYKNGNIQKHIKNNIQSGYFPPGCFMIPSYLLKGIDQKQPPFVQMFIKDPVDQKKN